MARAFDSRENTCFSRLSDWIARRGRTGVVGPPGERVTGGGSQFSYTYHVGRPDPFEDEDNFGLGGAVGEELTSPPPEPTSPTFPEATPQPDHPEANRWNGSARNNGHGIGPTPPTQPSLALMLSENA